MENAEIYHKSNTIQKRDALLCLEEYAHKIKWKNDGNTVLDIGSGDGSVTANILAKFLPSNCTRVMGSDKSERMVQFAKKHHVTNLINFTTLDIERDLPDELRGKFNLVFSNYALNWITQQELAFTNIYNLLASGGTCLLILVGYVPVYTVYRALARQKKWSIWLRDVERVVSPYHDCQDSEKVIKKMMTSIGFNNVDVRCTEKTYTYIGLEAIKIYKALNSVFKKKIKKIRKHVIKHGGRGSAPYTETAYRIKYFKPRAKEINQDFIAGVDSFKIPQELMEDFQEDYLKTIQDLKLKDYVHYNEEGSVKTRITYRLITVFAEK